MLLNIAEIDRHAVRINGPQAKQAFLRGPSGNIAGLHRMDQRRFEAANRQAA